MKRVAYCSPVNPAASGISDYSEELLPYLGQYFDLTLYLDDGLKPANPALSRCLTVRPISQLANDQRRQRYDAILYHLGNSSVHAGIAAALRQIPGVVVLHDLVLHHLALHEAAMVRRDLGWYRGEAERRYGANGARVADLMLRGQLTPAAFEMPFNEDLLAPAEGLITHSRYARDHVLAIHPELPAAVVPMGVPLLPEIPRDVARARLGLPADALLLASFGHINPYKRLDAVLRLLATLRRERENVQYLLVGSVSPNYDARALVRRAGLENAVTITGYVDRAAFEDYVAAADICLNLRHPTAGETSASLLRLLGAGRPTLVTASGSFTELPAGIAAQVDPDASEDALLLAYCRLLADRPEVAQALGSQARAYVAREHTLDLAAAGYVRFLAERYGWGDIARVRGPLWEVAAAAPREASIAPQPMTQPTTPTAAPSMLCAAAAAALAGIGATEDDQALLRAVAEAIAAITSA